MIFILLPAYNEKSSIIPLISGLRKTIRKTKEQYRIVIVNDGSIDSTKKFIEKIKGKDIHVLNHKINRGLGETIRDGLEYISSRARDNDIIIRLDCDVTHEPKYIPLLVKKINRGADIVICSRFQKGGGSRGVSRYRNSISQCANVILKILFPIRGVREYSCGYRAYRASLIKKAIEIYGNDFISLKGLGFTCTVEKIIKLRELTTAKKIQEIPFVLRYDKKEGPSKMLSSITTLGYFALILKSIYPWGKVAKERQKKIAYYRKFKK